VDGDQNVVIWVVLNSRIDPIVRGRERWGMWLSVEGRSREVMRYAAVEGVVYNEETASGFCLFLLPFSFSRGYALTNSEMFYANM